MSEEPNTWNVKLKKFITKIENYFWTGTAKINSIRYVFQFFVIIDIWIIARWDSTIPAWLYAPLSVFGIGGLIFSGWMWDKMHMFNYAAEFSNERNPFFIRTDARLVRIEKMLEDIKK